MTAPKHRAGRSFPLVLDGVLARAVARRTKTQIRRAARTVTMDDGQVVLRKCGLEQGSTYRVQTPEQMAAINQPAAKIDTDPLARIVVTGIDLQRLGDMTAVDAQAEGHASLPAFADWWLRRTDRSWPPREPKLCRECRGHAEYRNGQGELVACTACDLGEVIVDVEQTDQRILERFAAFADRQVWVVSFRLDDRRFMHRDSQRGYTSDPREAMLGEPEVIGDPLPVWRARAEQRRRQDQADADAMRLSGLPTIDDQLAELKRMAAERGVDLTRDRHVVEEAAVAIGRKLAR